MAQRRQEASLLGSNTSEFARYVFASINKSMPCRWDGTTIVVSDVVRISDPYNEEACESSNSSALQRVRRMVKNMLSSFTPSN